MKNLIFTVFASFVAFTGNVFAGHCGVSSVSYNHAYSQVVTQAAYTYVAPIVVPLVALPVQPVVSQVQATVQQAPVVVTAPVAPVYSQPVVGFNVYSLPQTYNYGVSQLGVAAKLVNTVKVVAPHAPAKVVLQQKVVKIKQPVVVKQQNVIVKRQEVVVKQQNVVVKRQNVQNQRLDVKVVNRSASRFSANRVSVRVRSR